MGIPLCPHCQTATSVKFGRNPSESQRYTCKTYQRVHTLEPMPKGYPAEVHTQALRLYLEGNGIRRIGRLLQVNHQTVTNWINAAAAKVTPTPPQPTPSAVIDLDELYTFVVQKKTNLYVMTAVDRRTRCIVGWRIEPTRVFEMLQSVVDQSVTAQQYFRDGVPCYADVYYHGATYEALRNKSQTYSVEGDNAELRHYLAQLHRSSRCYSKCVTALRRAVGLLVEAWNRRQLFRRRHPQYTTNVIDFISV